MDRWKHQKVSSAPTTRRWEVQSQQQGMAECGLMTTTGLVGLLLYISTVSGTALCKLCAGSSITYLIVLGESQLRRIHLLLDEMPRNPSGSPARGNNWAAGPTCIASRSVESV